MSFRDPPHRAAASPGGLQRAAGLIGRLARAWRSLPSDRRLAAGAALGLFVTLFLPWYQRQYFAIIAGHAQPASDSQTAWGAFSFVEAAVLVVALGVLTLLFKRAEGRPFHLPGGDGWVITAAGFWTCILIIWRIFDKQGATSHTQYVTSFGIEWGIFVALADAGLLAYAGSRVRAAHQPEPPLPGSAPARGPGGGREGPGEGGDWDSLAWGDPERGRRDERRARRSAGREYGTPPPARAAEPTRGQEPASGRPRDQASGRPPDPTHGGPPDPVPGRPRRRDPFAPFEEGAVSDPPEMKARAMRRRPALSIDGEPVRPDEQPTRIAPSTPAGESGPRYGRRGAGRAGGEGGRPGGGEEQLTMPLEEPGEQ